MTNKVIVQVKTVYGIERYYPVNEQARYIASLANQTTLTDKELRIAAKMGFELEFQHSKARFEQHIDQEFSGAMLY
ncbi:hypothetical protein EBZ39_18200 [bacterium]|nr:hypothetical protein [bacterium]